MFKDYLRMCVPSFLRRHREDQAPHTDLEFVEELLPYCGPGKVRGYLEELRDGLEAGDRLVEVLPKRTQSHSDPDYR